MSDGDKEEDIEDIIEETSELEKIEFKDIKTDKQGILKEFVVLANYFVFCLLGVKRLDIVSCFLEIFISF